MSAYAKFGDIDGEVMNAEIFKGVSAGGTDFHYAETETGDDFLVIQVEDGFDFYAVPDDTEQRLIEAGALDPTDGATMSGIWDDIDQVHLIEDVGEERDLVERQLGVAGLHHRDDIRLDRARVRREAIFLVFARIRLTSIESQDACSVD